MKNVVAFLVLAICVFSCKKDSPINQLGSSPKATDSTLVLKDSILYKSLDSNARVVSIRSWLSIPNPNSSCSNKISLADPSDSSASLKIDVNGDNIMDFVFLAYHSSSTAFCGNGSPCASPDYNTQISIECINIIDSIKNSETDYKYPLSNDTSAVMSNTDHWFKGQGFFSLSQPCTPFSNFYIFLKEMYIGIKIGNNYGWIHVKPINYNGVQIIDYAINLTPGNPIKAGQKK